MVTSMVISMVKTMILLKPTRGTEMLQSKPLLLKLVKGSSVAGNQ